MVAGQGLVRLLQIAEDGESYEALVRAGNALHRSGRPEQAQARFQEAVELDPARGEAHRGLGGIAEQRDDLALALAHYRKAAAARPDDAETLGDLARTLHRSARPGEARTYYERALLQDPRRPDLLNHLGRLLEDSGELEGAAVRYEQALAIDPRSIPGWTNLAVIRTRQGRYAEAAEQTAVVVRLDPDNASAHRRLGRLQLRLQRWPEAAQALRQALVLEPFDLDARLWLATALEADGQRAEAEIALQQTRQLASASGQLAIVRRVEAQLERLRES